MFHVRAADLRNVRRRRLDRGRRRRCVDAKTVLRRRELRAAEDWHRHNAAKYVEDGSSSLSEFRSGVRTTSAAPRRRFRGAATVRRSAAATASSATAHKSQTTPRAANDSSRFGASRGRTIATSFPAAAKHGWSRTAAMHVLSGHAAASGDSAV